MGMEFYAELVLQAGLFHEEITLPEIYELATAVINDGVISTRRLEKAKTGSGTGWWTTVPVLKEMTAAELEGLRERVVAKCPAIKLKTP